MIGERQSAGIPPFSSQKEYYLFQDYQFPLIHLMKSAPVTLFKDIYKDTFFYILYFQKVGIAERELEKNIKKIIEA